MAKMTSSEAEKVVDSSADKAKNYNLPPLGGLRLGIKRIAGDIVGGFSGAMHAIGESWRGFRLRGVERRESKAQSRLDKALKWALGPRNKNVKDERLASPRVTSAQARLDKIRVKKDSIEEDRQASADRLTTGDVNRSQDIQRTRNLLVYKRNEEMANKWLRYKQKEMIAQGYTRKEARDVINSITREDKDELIRELADGRAISAAGALNERGHGVIKSQIEYIDREKKRIRDQIGKLNANLSRDIADLRSRGVGSIDMAVINAAADALANGTPPDSFGASSLRLLGKSIHDNMDKINKLNARSGNLTNKRRDASRQSKESEHNIELVRNVVKARSAAAAIRLNDLWDRIESGE